MRKLWTGVAALTISGLLLVACGNGRTSAKAGEPATQVSSAPVAAPTVKSESKTFRDWFAVCDNGNLCSAYTGGSTGWILVQMGPGPEGQPTVRVGMWPDSGDELKTPIALIIDGKSHATSAGPEDTSSAILPAGDARAVISELAAGRAISVSSGGQTVELSVAGVSASLLWFDERQGRLDTTTALIRKGAKPASAVRVAPVLPVISAAPAVSQAGFETSLNPLNSDENARVAVLPAPLEALPAVKQCRADTDFNDGVQKAITASRLNATTELWGIPCESGAYNISYAYYLAGPRGTDPRVVNFPGLDGVQTPTGEDGDNGWLTNPGYDPNTRTLTAFAKARGIGDCGVAQSWTWTGQAFVLNREQVMSDCFGITSELWPTTFRSR